MNNFIPDKIRVICEKLKSISHSRVCGLDDFVCAETDYKKSNELPDTKNFRPVSEFKLAGADRHFWMYSKIPPTKACEGKRLYFSLSGGDNHKWNVANPQCLVYLNGEMIQGLDINHTELPLNFDTEYEMYIYYYTGMEDAPAEFKAELVMIDTRIEKLFYDVHVPYEAAMCLDENDDNRILILKTLERALSYLDMRVPLSDMFYKSLEETEDFLKKEFYGSICRENGKEISCIGHTHIDVAWLWRLRQTAEKAQRSFSTVIKLMEDYPEYKFMSSQPQLYEFVKDNAPELYEKIKEKVREGRWEPEGAMWLEADCNLTSGESLIRQIMFGKRFIKEEFGVESRILWLPDVFGYSAALPQILKKCGVDKFVTSKISWNESNQMPYDSFEWEGIDGTEIFTYFITAQDLPKSKKPENFTTYNGYIRPKQVLGTWKRYQQKEYTDCAMIPFGFGDGGGGPTKDMLEQQRRLAFGIPGIPKTKIEPLSVFLDRAYESFKENSRLLKRTPRWVGELYLEFHRGTYTSMARNKKNNRKSELLYQKAEQLSVFDMLMLGGSYDQSTINAGWKKILLNQFHDIIPGSSIGGVYEDSDISYSEIFDAGNNIVKEKITEIAGNVDSEGGLLVYNPNSFECSDTVIYNGESIYADNIPPMGYKVIKPKRGSGNVSVSGRRIENKYYVIELDENGAIISLYDKENEREVVKQGERLNELQLFEDFPKEYDAWEISVYYKQKMWIIDDVTSMEAVYDGVRAGVRITRDYLNSRIVQTIYLYENSRRIDFENNIDWHEEHVLLKAAFPVDIHANEAVYDIQFGNIKRPTHSNTSWDAAKFEVCAHKWADISENGYGVSLINDCKYGHSAEGSTLKLTLLKCALYPNPDADKEVHEFKYSLIPHRGDFREADIVREAQLFNQPLTALEIPAQNGTLPAEFSLIGCDSPNIIIETVKKAENSNDIIIRLYDAFDRRCTARLFTGFDVKKAYVCDMLENNEREIAAKGRELEVPVGNFEVVTLKLCI
ncbi:MAG: alpha-mannosidase [Clostridiales bacterium]|nr:alpha-mannosidase [Clostridiales bacterium]